MSLKEADRYAVIAQVIERTMGQSDAARWLNISVRQVKRLVPPSVKTHAFKASIFFSAARLCSAWCS